MSTLMTIMCILGIILFMVGVMHFDYPIRKWLKDTAFIAMVYAGFSLFALFTVSIVLDRYISIYNTELAKPQYQYKQVILPHDTIYYKVKN